MCIRGSRAGGGPAVTAVAAGAAGPAVTAVPAGAHQQPGGAALAAGAARAATCLLYTCPSPRDS